MVGKQVNPSQRELRSEAANNSAVRLESSAGGRKASVLENTIYNSCRLEHNELQDGMGMELNEFAVQDSLGLKDQAEVASI